ncbi:MAG: sporulation protein YabP [Clostridiales bacterium]|nr:sporulation protein YabP [Clostridiales bacterium]
MEKNAAAQPAARKAHSLALENRQKAALTGVSEVLAFDENQVILMTDSGEIALTGDNLHVTKLMLEEGQLTVEGRLDSIFYTQKSPRRGLFRRKNQ